MYNVEVELGKQINIKDQSLEGGNRGYVNKKEPVTKRADYFKGTIEPAVEEAGAPQVVVDESVNPAMSEPVKEVVQKTYTVEKGDTLQKISKKVYGTSKKWHKIYELNKEKLKSPDKIKAGQKLLLPE